MSNDALNIKLEIVLSPPHSTKNTLCTAAWVITSARDPARYPTPCVMAYGIVTAPVNIANARAEQIARNLINTHNTTHRHMPNVLQWRLLKDTPPADQLAARILRRYPRVSVTEPHTVSHAGIFGTPSVENSIHRMQASIF